MLSFLLPFKAGRTPQTTCLIKTFFYPVYQNSCPTKKKKKENLTATTLSAAVVCIRVNNIHFHSSYYLQIYLSVLHCLPFRKEIFCGKNHLFTLGLPNITKDILLSDGRSRIIVQFLQFLQCSS